jgi:trehalose-6-phosphatase
VLFIGDDTTDAAGMAAVRELRQAGGLRGAAIAVLHDDTPEAVLLAADYTLPGVTGVERLLAWLADRVEDAG